MPCSNFAQASAGAGVGGRLGAISSRLMRFHQTATMLRTDRTDAGSKEGDRGGRHRARERDRTTRDGMSTTVARQPSCPLLGRSVHCAAAMGGCRMRMDCVLRQKEEDARARSLACLLVGGRKGGRIVLGCVDSHIAPSLTCGETCCQPGRGWLAIHSRTLTR